MNQSLLLDLGVVLQLVILEGLLSFDNALALAALVEKRLKDPADRKRALTWGIWGAYLFRTIVIFIGVWLMANPWIRVAAGLYLVWIAFDELYLKRHHQDNKDLEMRNFGISFLKLTPFWSTVVSVELMDIMFSIDSVAVALALSNKKWVLILGAVLGIVMMRIAAQFFIVLIEKFPILTKTAFLLVALAGINILLDTKNLPIPFSGGFHLNVDMAIPEHPFLALLFLVFLGSIVLNWRFPKAFKK
jgi:YkoY family integral membrane protein